MADHQLARTLSKEEADSIVTFLKALTGELPTEYIKEPPLPKSTAKTPKPDKA
jgi:cytochrome c peroxidase